MNVRKKLKSLVLLAVLCALGNVFWVSQCFASNLTVSKQIREIFPDKEVAKIISDNLKKVSFDDFVSQDELNTITTISCFKREELQKKLSIEGVQYFNGLRSFFVANCRVDDLTPLPNLTDLYEIHMIFTQLNDLRPLSTLVNLHRLELSYNQITDLTPLSQLNNLYWLDLRNNRIFDLNPLSRLTNLEILNISNNQIRDFSPLYRLKKLSYICSENNFSMFDSRQTGFLSLVKRIFA